MKTIKKIIVLSAVLSLSVFFCSCSESPDGGDTSSDTSVNSSGSSAPAKTPAELTDDEKKAADEADISYGRYCTDNTAITETATKVLTQYYDGMADADHDKCFGAFPDFYKAALEKENESYGETNDEYIQSIRKKFTETYGDDFYVYPTVTNILQISDTSMAELQERIRKSFDTDSVIDDLYYVYFTENARGSLDRTSYNLEFALLEIDGAYYLYDDYYEVPDEDETVS